MSEDFLQFIWKYGLFDRFGLFTDTGEAVEVISMGLQNHDAGPDFLIARIRIGRTVWAGNVEVHLCSSDWYRHGHHRDRAFDNVILQVVCRHDRKVYRPGQEPLPALELKFDEALYVSYRNLLSRNVIQSCRHLAAKLEPVVFNGWMESLAEERIRQKGSQLSLMLEQNRNNWEETFYIALARGFGMGLNATPFEMTARSLPLICLSRYRGSINQMEALLYGQAGLLDAAAPDDYSQFLKREYAFLRKKYKLTAIEPHLWRFLRLRPSSFPTIRISQFASIIHNRPHLFSCILETASVQELYGLFSARASAYWDDHYSFGRQSRKRPKTLGRACIRCLLINAVIPCLYVFGCLRDRKELKDRAMEWLRALPPEHNHLTREWLLPGSGTTSAMQSQGLLQLGDNYCRRRRCLSCPVGIRMITGA